MAGNLVQGAVFTVMVVRAGLLRDPAFEQELAEQIGRSPRFFLNAPVVLDLKEVAEFTRAGEFAEAKEILRRHTLTLVGVQNASPAQVEAAADQPDLRALRRIRSSQPSRRAAGAGAHRRSEPQPLSASRRETRQRRGW